jgi:hypothetical protein
VITEICNSVQVSLSPAQTGGTNQHKPAQTGTNRHKRAQTGTNWHKPAQTGTNRHKPAQTGTNRHKPAQILCRRTHFKVCSGGKLTCPLFYWLKITVGKKGGNWFKIPLAPRKNKIWFLAGIISTLSG